MDIEKERSQLIPVKLKDGSVIHIHVTSLGGTQDVAFKGLPDFEHIIKPIEQIADAISSTVAKADKASVEFGVSIGLESGNLTALLVKGTSSANIKITLEWNKSKA